MRLFIEPLEHLLFRGSLPFNVGEGNLAISLFPPTPETLQGAIRGMLASINHPHSSMSTAFSDPNLVNLIGDRDDYGRFRITHISLGKYKQETPDEVEVLLPPPSHILQDERGKRFQLVPRAISDLMVATNQPDEITHVLALRERSVETKPEPLRGWISQASLLQALSPDANLDDLKLVKSSDLYERESRLGISVDSVKQRTRDGLLYQQQVIRMQKGVGFVVDIGLTTEADKQTLISDDEVQAKLFSKQSTGWLTLGGDQRAAHFRILNHPHEAKLPTRGNLVYLATPAYFPTAWKPSAKFLPLDKPITAAIPRPEAIGGWKLNSGNADGEQKGLRLCVPAGSVFFYDQQVSLSQPLTEYGEQIGYGITYRGDWKK